ncbi:M23 family metallopeptidase [Bordetella petrii]|uniref:M23 family metallopeptidase n=1 Tax=Bordetella petrii TaxID=94624 RepID=UPI001E41606D|nr:M23 family metallopeptidase [Bordetella petrii]MCD0501844.1 M23 family metallopeptidase [Bordetella petrii]
MHARDGQPGQVALGGTRLGLLVAAVVATAALVGATVQRYLTPVAPPAYSVDWGTYAQDGQPAREAAFVRENVGLLAAKVGELQAKLVGIDGLGRRVAQVAGVAYTDPELAAEIKAPAQAGQVMDDLFTDRQPPSAESAEVLGRQLDELQARLAHQTDNLRMLDVALTRRSADQARLPSTMPVTEYPYLSSSYGWRRNPVTHRYAMHEGLDFAAPSGTPILAASGGVVLEASYLAGYGNTVEIDHGDGLITRYAHASKLLVKPGDLVGRGQEIARVGSTGRSTGPHLHFEVRLAGQPLDPRLFLQSPEARPPVVAKAADAAAGVAVTQ